MTSSTTSRGAAKWALLSLAIGSFGIGMTEFVVMGLLPNIAADVLPTQWDASQGDADQIEIVRGDGGDRCAIRLDTSAGSWGRHLGHSSASSMVR